MAALVGKHILCVQNCVKIQLALSTFGRSNITRKYSVLKYPVHEVLNLSSCRKDLVNRHNVPGFLYVRHVSTGETISMHSNHRHSVETLTNSNDVDINYLSSFSAVGNNQHENFNLTSKSGSQVNTDFVTSNTNSTNTIFSEPTLRPEFPTESCNAVLSDSNIYFSSADKTNDSECIPEPPVPPSSFDVTSDILSQLEPSLASQGLGSLMTPVGWVQILLDWVHVTCGLPWWGSIAICTLLARSLMFPIFIRIQRNSVNLQNNMPQIQLLQLKLTEARQGGNHLDVAKYTNELMIFMNEKNCNPMKSMLAPLAQAPVFLSFFLALRGMTNVPVESFKHGGLFWFTDLTIPDPYYILPLITSLTLLTTIEVGGEGAPTSQTARYVMRAIPFIMIPFIINFPGAILCYWVTTNGITLLQVALVKIPKVRQYFNIPKRIHFDQSSLPMKKKGFVDSFKDTYTNSKIAREMDDRLKADQMKFRRAGMGPVPKTYKFDPTKQRKD